MVNNAKWTSFRSLYIVQTFMRKSYDIKLLYDHWNKYASIYRLCGDYVDSCKLLQFEWSGICKIYMIIKVNTYGFLIILDEFYFYNCIRLSEMLCFLGNFCFKVLNCFSLLSSKVSYLFDSCTFYSCALYMC